MKGRILSVALGAALVAAASGLSWGERGTGAAPKGDLAFVVTEPRVQAFPASRWVYVSKKTRLAGGQVGRDGAALMERLTPEVLAAVRPTSGRVIEYLGNTGDPDTDFEMRVGVMVADGTKAPAGFTEGELSAYQAYTVVFSGPVEHLSRAYTMAYQRMFEEGKFPSGTSREHVLYWEGPESANNVSVIQIGIEGP